MKIAPVVAVAAASLTLFAADNTTASNTVTLDTIQTQGHSDLPRDYSATTGVLGSKSVLDTPFSVYVIDSNAIADRQANTMETLFLRDASVNMNTGAYSSFGNTVSVRGLMLDYSNSYKINGLPINNFNSALPYEVFEQVEVLKGLSGFMYGFGTPGGIINYVTKKPTDAPLFSVSAGYRSDSIFTEAIDLGGRAGEGKRFGYRVNVVNEKGDTVNSDGATGSIDRQTASVSLDYRISERIKWTADMIYNNRRVENSASWINTLGIAATDPLPKAVNGSRNLGIPGTFEEMEDLLFQTGIDYQYHDNWKASLDYSASRNNTSWVKNLVTLTDTEGNLSTGIYHNDFNLDFDSVQLMTEGSLEAMGVANKIVAGIEWTENRVNRGVTNGTERRVTWGYATDNLYDPQAMPTYDGFDPMNPPFSETVQRAVFLSDTLQFNDALSMLLGVRFNRYRHTTFWNGADPYEDDAVTPTFALTYKPATDTSYYFSYVESLEQGSTVPETLIGADYKYSNHDEFLPPLESRQYELGLKTERENWTASAALFRIERGAEIDTDAAAPYTYTLVQDGIQLYQGVELSGSLQPRDDLTLTGSLMSLKATYDDMGVSSSIEGNDVAGAPKTQASLEAAYKVPTVDSLKLTAGARHTGKTPVDQNNNWEMDAVTLYDVGANYKTKISSANLLTLRLSVTNLTDEAYWAATGSNSIRIGEPRVIAMNAQLDW